MDLDKHLILLSMNVKQLKIFQSHGFFLSALLGQKLFLSFQTFQTSNEWISVHKQITQGRGKAGLVPSSSTNLSRFDSCHMLVKFPILLWEGVLPRILWFSPLIKKQYFTWFDLDWVQLIGLQLKQYLCWVEIRNDAHHNTSCAPTVFFFCSRSRLSMR